MPLTAVLAQLKISSRWHPPCRPWRQVVVSSSALGTHRSPQMSTSSRPWIEGRRGGCSRLELSTRTCSSVARAESMDDPRGAAATPVASEATPVQG